MTAGGGNGNHVVSRRDSSWGPRSEGHGFESPRGPDSHYRLFLSAVLCAFPDQHGQGGAGRTDRHVVYSNYVMGRVSAPQGPAGPARARTSASLRARPYGAQRPSRERERESLHLMRSGYTARNTASTTVFRWLPSCISSPHGPARTKSRTRGSEL